MGRLSELRPDVGESEAADIIRTMGPLCRIAAWNSSSYEWFHHEPLAASAGISTSALDYIKSTPSSRVLANAPSPAPGLLTPQQAAVLAFVDHSTVNVKVPKEVVEELKKLFDEKVVAQVAVTVGELDLGH